MATPGPRTQDIHRRLAGSLLRLARAQAGMSQRQLAVAAGVPASSVARIETSARQPSLPVLLRLLAAADVDLRLHLEPYDDHDDVLEALAAQRSTEERAAVEAGWAPFDEAAARARPAKLGAR